MHYLLMPLEIFTARKRAMTNLVAYSIFCGCCCYSCFVVVMFWKINRGRVAVVWGLSSRTCFPVPHYSMALVLSGRPYLPCMAEGKCDASTSDFHFVFVCRRIVLNTPSKWVSKLFAQCTSFVLVYFVTLHVLKPEP